MITHATKESDRLRILFLLKYARQGAASRHRVFQYVPYLEAAGWTVVCEPLFSDRYLAEFYGTSKRSPMRALAAYWRRLAFLTRTPLDRFDVVYVQNEVFPRLPFFVTYSTLRHHGGVVVDYDDAVFVRYQNTLLHKKVSQLMALSREVIVGNDYLSGYARRFTDAVTILPTVVDMDRYTAKADYVCAESRFVIGWIGTPVTARYLASCAGALQQIAAKHSIVLRCIGTPPNFSLPGVPVQNVAWDEATECDLIRRFDIGIMPLVDEPFAWGKCGFKLVQYMGCGVPAIGANLGANRQIIDHGKDGFLANCDSEYVDLIGALIGDQRLRESIGRAGRKRIETAYSLQSTQAAFEQVLRRAALARRAERRECLNGDPRFQ